MNERLQEISRLRQNIDTVAGVREQECINQGDFLSVFKSRLQKMKPLEGIDREMFFYFKMSEINIKEADKAAVAIILEAPDSIDIWIEDIRDLPPTNALHLATERMLIDKIGKKPHSSFTSAYIIVDTEGKIHLLKDTRNANFFFKVIQDNENWLGLLERYPIDSLIGGIRESMTAGGSTYNGIVIDRDVIGEIRERMMVEKYRENFEMTDEEFEEFRKKTNLALTMQVPVNYESIAREITGKTD